jgi:hypothetical protein
MSSPTRRPFVLISPYWNGSASSFLGLLWLVVLTWFKKQVRERSAFNARTARAEDVRWRLRRMGVRVAYKDKPDVVRHTFVGIKPIEPGTDAPRDWYVELPRSGQVIIREPRPKVRKASARVEREIEELAKKWDKLAGPGAEDDVPRGVSKPTDAFGRPISI